MRVLALLLLLALLLPTAVAQTDAEKAELARQQEELYSEGLVWMGVTFALIVLGAAGMWWVNHRYHPPGETARAKSRRD